MINCWDHYHYNRMVILDDVTLLILVPITSELTGVKCIVIRHLAAVHIIIIISGSLFVVPKTMDLTLLSRRSSSGVVL